ncbi:MAG: GNAT family N-acetyltransferase [Myxococcota bacterium]|nr:GNAT family N-acetyltransferase [Myxococcota bacterium]
MPRYTSSVGVPSAETAAAIVALYPRLFPGAAPLELSARLALYTGVFGVLAWEQSRLVGFKLGYVDRPGRFYSWLGGVDPEFRRRGIGRALAALQHDRCLEAGYTRIRTHTANTNTAMLMLNLGCGFQIVGLTALPPKGVRVVLEKPLSRP